MSGGTWSVGMVTTVCGIFLRDGACAREAVPDLDLRLAPVLAVGIIGIIGIGFALFWAASMAGIE